MSEPNSDSQPDPRPHYADFNDQEQPPAHEQPGRIHSAHVDAGSQSPTPCPANIDHTSQTATGDPRIDHGEHAGETTQKGPPSASHDDGKGGTRVYTCNAYAPINPGVEMKEHTGHAPNLTVFNSEPHYSHPPVMYQHISLQSPPIPGYQLPPYGQPVQHNQLPPYGQSEQQYQRPPCGQSVQQYQTTRYDQPIQPYAASMPGYQGNYWAGPGVTAHQADDPTLQPPLGRPQYVGIVGQQLASNPPQHRDAGAVKIYCANCRKNDHVAGVCVMPRRDGYIHGCIICNRSHSLDRCRRLNKLIRKRTVADLFKLVKILADRPRLPPAYTQHSWMKYYVEAREYCDEHGRPPPGFVLPTEFPITADSAKRQWDLPRDKRPWHHWNYEKPDYTLLTPDPSLRDLATKRIG